MSDTTLQHHQPIPEKSGFKLFSGWSRLFLEMLAITFGVMLAFVLNEWRSESKRKAFTELSLTQVEAEIDRNYDKINAAYDYHVKLYKNVIAAQNDGRTLAEIGFRGTQPPRLERAAYEIALGNSVFAQHDPEESQRIVATYLDFENVSRTHALYSSGLPNLILQVESDKDARVLQYMQSAFMDFIYSEAETLNKIASYTDREGVGEYWKVFYPPEGKTETRTQTD
jgi:hypothetical protein